MISVSARIIAEAALVELEIKGWARNLGVRHGPDYGAFGANRCAPGSSPRLEWGEALPDYLCLSL